MGSDGGARRRLVVGMSGVTGIGVGVRLLELTRAADVETHLVAYHLVVAVLAA